MYTPDAPQGETELPVAYDIHGNLITDPEEIRRLAETGHDGRLGYPVPDESAQE